VSALTTALARAPRAILTLPPEISIPGSPMAAVATVAVISLPLPVLGP
jgi:hypothetical protein